MSNLPAKGNKLLEARVAVNCCLMFEWGIDAPKSFWSAIGPLEKSQGHGLP